SRPVATRRSATRMLLRRIAVRVARPVGNPPTRACSERSGWMDGRTRELQLLSHSTNLRGRRLSRRLVELPDLLHVYGLERSVQCFERLLAIALEDNLADSNFLEELCA